MCLMRARAVSVEGRARVRVRVLTRRCVLQMLQEMLAELEVKEETLAGQVSPTISAVCFLFCCVCVCVCASYTYCTR